MLSTKVFMAFENQEKHLKDTKGPRSKAFKNLPSSNFSSKGLNESNIQDTITNTIPKSTKGGNNTLFLPEMELSSDEENHLVEGKDYHSLSDNDDSDGELERRILPVVPFNSPYSSSDEDDYKPYNNEYTISNPVVPYNTPYSSDDEDEEKNERRTVSKLSVAEPNGSLKPASIPQMSGCGNKRHYNWPKRGASLHGRRIESTKVEKPYNEKGSIPCSTNKRRNIASGMWFGGKSPIEKNFRGGIQEDLDFWS